MAMDATKFKVESKEFNEDLSSGVVVVSYPTTDANEAHEFLGSMAAKNLAIGEGARAGMTDPRLSTSPYIYLVDSKGEPITDGKTQKPAGFRASITIVKQLLS